MKISNLKKYILFIIISFITVIGTAFADDKVISPEFEGSPVVMDSKDYLGLDCKAKGELQALSLTKKGGDYYIAFAKEPKKSGTDKIVCTWTGRGIVGFEDEKGERTFTFYYNILSPSSVTITINGTVKDDLRKDVIAELEEKMSITDINIKRISDKKNADYLDWTGCTGGALCSVAPTEKALNVHETVYTTAKFKISYNDGSGTKEKDLNVTFNISYTGGIRIYPGGYGTCSINSSQWKAQNYPGYSYWESIVTGSVNLPSCTAKDSERGGSVDKTSGLLEFKGWVRVPDEAYENRDYQKIGQCAPSAITGSVPAMDGGDYVACYSYKAGVQLVFDNVSSELVGASQCKKTSAGVYYCTSEGSFTLPNIKQKDTPFGKNKTFVGWVKNNEGSVIKPGTPVDTDDYATYYAKYEKTVVEVDRYKSVYENQNSFLAVPNMKSCSAASNPNLKVKYQNKQCLVSGLKKTNKGEYIDVNVSIQEEDGSSKNVVYKFEVKAASNNSEALDGSFVIDVDARIVSGVNNDYALNDFEHQMCKTAKISFSGDEYTDINISKGLNSNNYDAVSECDDGKTYFALCMDPGRAGPNGEIYNIEERVSQSSDLGKMIGEIIDLINSKTNPTAFTKPNNSVRIAAHVAIRTVALITGYSGVTEQSDTKYYAHYVAYRKLAEDLAKVYKDYTDADGHVPNPGDANYDEYRNKIKAAVDYFGIDTGNSSTDSTVLKYLYDMFTHYKNYQFTEGGAFQRTIDSKKTTVTGDNSYEIVYKGKITLPAKTELKMDGKTSNYVYLNKTGVKGTLVSLVKNDKESTTSPKQYVYDYVVKIEVTDAAAVEIPKNREQEKDYSLVLKYGGGLDYSSVRIGNPAAGTASKQRMLIIDTNDPTEVYIYFNIDGDKGSICSSIKSLDYKTCKDEASCSSTFNAGLFKAAGCCSEILDEETYSYLIANVCNGECSVSTMSNVCSYNPGDNLSVDEYEIKEGAYYTSEAKKYSDAIGTCVVNVKGNYAADVDAEKDLSSYQKQDDRGNSIMVSAYNTNEYCQVSCREDWKITMSAFGNFVGKNAVLAGTYFQNHDNDIFIEGGRTCYTTYLDYDLLMKDLVGLSTDLVDQYNNYSNSSHSYSDIKAQDVSSDTFKFVADSGCLKYEYKVTKEDNPDTEADETTYGWSCISSNTEYGHYELDLNHKFKGPGDAEGTYKNYSPTVKDSGTQDPLENEPTTPQYSMDTQKGTACSFPSAPTGAGTVGETKDTLPETSAGGCYSSDTDANRSEAFEKLKQDMMDKAKNALDGYRGAMSSDFNGIISKYEQFWNCQHFELYNGSDDSNDKKNNPTSYDMFMGSKRSFVQILTMFEPFVSYTYDEDVYMTILQDDNVLIEYDALNDKVFETKGKPDGYKNYTNTSVKDVEIGYSDKCLLAIDDSECNKADPVKDAELSRNLLNFEYYDPSGVWTNKTLVSTYGKNSESKPVNGFNACGTDDGICNKSLSIEKDKANDKVVGKIITLCSITAENTGPHATTDGKTGDVVMINGANSVPDWIGGSCYSYTIYYYKAHYIEASIKNSSFYRNKGIWYTGPNDTREHGETLEEAWKNAAKRGGPSYNNNTQEEKNKWSVFVGNKDDEDVISGNLNIFPVSMTTARNLYQYTYEFTQIGSYSDGRLGRVMGDAEALIPQNQRTCFYEVVENICLCCGDPIVSYTSVDIPTAEKFVEDTGYNYKFNKDIDTTKAKGVLGFTPSTVALSDLDGATNRPLGNNWTGEGSFYYAGNKLTTNKGLVALKEIEELGEKVYLNTEDSGTGGVAPEYSFELRPSTLAAIRNYNDMYGYEVNFDNLKVYGRSSILPFGACSNPNSCKWFASAGNDKEIEQMNNGVANFGHYGSLFLENFDSLLGATNAASTSNLSNPSKDLEVCAIVKNSDANAAKNALRSKIDSGKCRWIDYIEIADVDDIWLGDKTQYFRLAFK